MRGRFIFETSWDDGWAEDVRLAEMLKFYGIIGTFFIPTKCELSDDEIKKIAEFHIIGGHTVSHPQDLKLLSDEDLKSEIVNNREWLQDLTGQEIQDFCYPRGRHDERVRTAAKHAGYRTGRTTLIGWTSVPPKLFERHTTVHTYNRKEHEGVRWQDYARQKWHEAIAEAHSGGLGYYHLWGHSALELQKNDWWNDLEDLLIFIKKEIANDKGLSPQ